MDLAACRAALRRYQPTLAVHQVHLLGEGWDSSAFLVDERLVVRFPKRPAVAETLLREARLLPELAPLLPCPLPRFSFLAPSGGDQGLPFAAYPLVAGTPLEHVSLTEPARARLAGDCGRFLAALHRFALKRARALGLETEHISSGPAGWAAFRLRATRAAAPLLADQEQQRLSSWFDRAEADGITRFSPVLAHADLGDEHLLVDPESGALTGVIDWADATIGDPAMDFAGFLNALGDEGAQRALATYDAPADARILTRAALYAAASPLHELIFAAETDNQAHQRSGLERLRQLVG